MKKIILALILCILILPLTYAKPEPNATHGPKITVTENHPIKNNQTIEPIRERLKEKLENKSIEIHQNRVREAVHALIQLRNKGLLQGGIGRNVSAIAKEFNNSVNKTIQLEERIKRRGVLKRFLFGGNQTISNELKEEVNKNKELLQQLNQTVNECNCSNETKAILQEQIQNIQQEQNRLNKLVKLERSRGILGWLFKWHK